MPSVSLPPTARVAAGLESLGLQALGQDATAFRLGLAEKGHVPADRASISLARFSLNQTKDAP